jgi:hypothetical protein
MNDTLLVSSAIFLSITSLLIYLGRARWFFPSIIGVASIFLFQLLSEASIARIGGKIGNGEKLYRLDCLRSDKGGKRPIGDTSEEFRHPCSNDAIDGTESDEMSGSNLCSSSTAIETPYISATRDCHIGQSSRCTLAQPCVPCEISRRDEFRDRWFRCQACSVRNDYGRCNFKDGVGPYCWAGADGWGVVPCQKCCTDNVAMYDKDGVCY